MFCPKCGKEVVDDAVVCVHCGRQISAMTSAAEEKAPAGQAAKQPAEGKDWLTTLLLCLFFGGLGIHSFYVGKTSVGIIQILTCGGCGIWVLIDFIMIITNAYKDASGNLLVKQ